MKSGVHDIWSAAGGCGTTQRPLLHGAFEHVPSQVDGSLVMQDGSVSYGNES